MTASAKRRTPSSPSASVGAGSTWRSVRSTRFTSVRICRKAGVHSARQGRVHWGGDHRVGLAQRRRFGACQRARPSAGRDTRQVTLKPPRRSGERASTTARHLRARAPASLCQERTAASTIRISTPPSLRMTCDRSKDAPHTGSSKSGAGVSRHARPASTIARAQSMQGKNVVVRWAPAVDMPRRAASKMARRSACSIQTNRSSPAWRSSRSRIPAGNELQVAISVPLWATRTAPTLRTRFGLKKRREEPFQSWRRAPSVGWPRRSPELLRCSLRPPASHSAASTSAVRQAITNRA